MYNDTGENLSALVFKENGEVLTMIAPKLPPNERERLASLKSLKILDTPIEERFERITRLAKKTFGVPMAMVTLVDKDRQWFKSCSGFVGSETARSVSFCGHAINSDAIMVVPNATQDERFADNPFVSGAPCIRFYAGRPLKSPDGHRVGTLCIVDTKARELSHEDALALEDLSRMVEQELRTEQQGETERELRKALGEAEQRAAVDGLTRLWNQVTIHKILSSEMDRSSRSGKNVAVMMIDVDAFKQVNDSLGHQEGDWVLAEIARILRGTLRAYDSIGRAGGDEFLIVMPDATALSARMVAERCRKHIEEARLGRTSPAVPVTISVGVGLGSSAADAVLADADRALYQAKHGGRNRVVLFVG